MFKRFRKELSFHTMLAPGVLVLLIFNYVPIAGLTIAFQNFMPTKGLFGKQEWIGLGNFRYIFEMPNTWRAISNTLIIATFKIVLGMIVPIIFALLLNELRSVIYKKVVQTVIYFPYFLSWIIFAGMLIDLLSPSRGVVNYFIKMLGFNPIYFLGSNKYFRSTMILTDVFKNFGFGTVIYLAALTSIDPTLYEAASIDGAGRLKQTYHITLPGMKTIVVLVMVLSLGGILNAGFDQIFNLMTPAVYETGDIIDTYVYRMAFGQIKFGPSTAIGFFKSIVSCILIAGSYFTAYKLFRYQIF